MVLDGDVIAQDWVDFFEQPYAEYVRPARELRERRMRELGDYSPPRCAVLREEFNRACSPLSDGTCDPDDVLRYYGGDIYDRYMALESCEEGVLQNCVTSIRGGAWEGEPTHTLVHLAASEFGQEFVAVDHGFGHGEHLLGMMSEYPRATYYAVEVASPFRLFLIGRIRRYVRGARIYPVWMFPGGAFTIDGLPGVKKPLDDGTVHAVHSCEVLEHIPHPERVVEGFARMLAPGGLLMLSTFFNSMGGHDPQHLTENDQYQDSEKWFRIVESYGLRRYWSDPRGVPKIWRKE